MEFHTDGQAAEAVRWWRAGDGVRACADGLSRLEGPVIECATSGSTGPAPKIIRRSVESWRASARVNAARFGYDPSDCFAALGDLSHSLALYALFEAQEYAGRFIGLAGHMRGGRLDTRNLTGVTVLHATPVQLRLLTGRAIDTVRLVLVGGGAFDAATRARAAALFPRAEVLGYFGASEASFIAIEAPDMPEGAVGRAYPQVEIALRTGEIFVRSPYLFDGYASGADPLVRIEDGWLGFGEIGEMVGPWLFVKGRANRMFTVADRNLFPEAVEAFAMAQGCTQACCVPMPDALRGALPVVFHQGGPDDLGQRISKAFDLRLARIARLENWPLLPSGKTDIRAVMELV